MTAITDASNNAVRDFQVAGVPSSGDHEPLKSAVRAVFVMIDAALASLGVNGAITVKKATLALLAADLAHDADVLAVVYNDATVANNGIYAKDGASGAGSWMLTGLALPSSFAADLAAVLASSEGAQAALEEALAIFGSVAELEAAVASGVAAVAPAQAARLGAEVAQGLSEGARDLAIAARTGAEAAEVAAEGQAAIALAAAAASGDVMFFDTKAAAVAAVGGMTEGDVVEVLADEDQSDARTRYRVESAALVLKANLSSAAYLSFTPEGTGAVVRSVQSKLRERGLSVLDIDRFAGQGGDDYAALLEAIQEADDLGVYLDFLGLPYNTSAAIAATLTGTLRWKSSGAVITYTGAGDINTAISLALPVAQDHVITGSGLGLDGNGKCNRGWYLSQPTADQTATLKAEGLSARNIQMFVAAAASSVGIFVQGGFGRITLDRPVVKNVMMRTGAGVTGARGVIGIAVVQTGTSGAYSKLTEIDHPIVADVYSEDAAYQYDMDGILVFANPDVDNTFGPGIARVNNPQISGCWGRDVKMQVSYGAVYEPRSLLNGQPTGGIINATYDFQTGSARLVGGEYIIDGVHVATGLCRFSTGPVAAPMSSEWQGGQVILRNGGTAAVLAAHDPTTTARRAISQFTGQSVKGTIASFVKVRTNGLDLDICRAKNVVVDEITDAFFLTGTRPGGSSPYRAILSASGCVHLDATLAALVKGNVSGEAAQFLLSQDADCAGFTTPTRTLVSASTTLTSGLQKVGPRYPEPVQTGTVGGVYYSGSERDFSLFLAAGESYTLPEHGYGGAYLAQIVMSVDAQSAALVSVGSALVSIWAGSKANIGVGTDPGSLDLRVWRSGNSLVIKNGNASSRVVMVKLFG